MAIYDDDSYYDSPSFYDANPDVDVADRPDDDVSIPTADDDHGIRTGNNDSDIVQQHKNVTRPIFSPGVGAGTVYEVLPTDFKQMGPSPIDYNAIIGPGFNVELHPGYPSHTVDKTQSTVDKDDIISRPGYPEPGTPNVKYIVPEGSRLWILQKPIRTKEKDGVDFDPITMAPSNYAEAELSRSRNTGHMSAIMFMQDITGKPDWIYLGQNLYDDVHGGAAGEKVWQAAGRAYPIEKGEGVVNGGWNSYESLVAALETRDALIQDAESMLQEFIDLGKAEEARQADIYRDARQGEIDASLIEHQTALTNYYNELATRNLTGADRERLEIERQSALQLAQEQAQGALERVQTEIAGRQSSLALEHESRQILQEQEYDLKFQIQAIDQAYSAQQAALNRALEAEQLLEARRHSQALEALEAERNQITAQAKQLEFFNMLAGHPEILFFAGASGLLQGLGDVGGDGGTAVQNIMNSLNAMPAVDNLQEFVNLSGLEQGIESMRLGAQTGLTQADIPEYLRGMGPLALKHHRVPLSAPIAAGAPPLSGAGYESLLRRQTGIGPVTPGAQPGFTFPEGQAGAAERMEGYAPVESIIEQMGKQVVGPTPSTFGQPPRWEGIQPSKDFTVSSNWPQLDTNWFTGGSGGPGPDKGVPKSEPIPPVESELPFTPPGGWLGQVQPQEKDFVVTEPDFHLTPIPPEYGYPIGVFIRKADIQGRNWDSATFGSMLPLLWKYEITTGPKGRVGMLRGQGGPWAEGNEPDWVKRVKSQWGG